MVNDDELSHAQKWRTRSFNKKTQSKAI